MKCVANLETFFFVVRYTWLLLSFCVFFSSRGSSVCLSVVIKILCFCLFAKFKYIAHYYMICYCLLFFFEYCLLLKLIIAVYFRFKTWNIIPSVYILFIYIYIYILLMYNCSFLSFKLLAVLLIFFFKLKILNIWVYDWSVLANMLTEHDVFKHIA